MYYFVQILMILHPLNQMKKVRGGAHVVALHLHSTFTSNEQDQIREDEENKVLAEKIDPFHTKPKIIVGKSIATLLGKKKKYDELDNEINQKDKDILNDITQGRTYNGIL